MSREEVIEWLENLQCHACCEQEATALGIAIDAVSAYMGYDTKSKK